MPKSAEKALRNLKLQESERKDQEEEEVSENESEEEGEESEEEESEESSEEDSSEDVEDTEDSVEGRGREGSDKGKQVEGVRYQESRRREAGKMSGATQTGARGGPQQEASASSSSSRPSTGESSVFALNSFRAQSGLHYDLTNLAISARTTAEKGLARAGLTLHSCSEDKANSHFIFRLRDSDLIDVRVGNPNGPNYRTPVCTCGGRPAVHGCKVSLILALGLHNADDSKLSICFGLLIKRKKRS